jgi:hypothetical protein
MLLYYVLPLNCYGFYQDLYDSYLWILMNKCMLVTGNCIQAYDPGCKEPGYTSQWREWGWQDREYKESYAISCFYGRSGRNRRTDCRTESS